MPPTGSVNRSRRFHSFRTEFMNRRPSVLLCNSQRRTAPHPEPFSSSRNFHQGEVFFSRPSPGPANEELFNDPP